MPISRYPRRGERLSPVLLRGLLQVPIRDYLQSGEIEVDNLSLADLDATVWGRFSLDECISLGKAIGRCLDRLYTLLLDSDISLPRPPRALNIEELRLEVRTCRLLTWYQKKRPLNSPDDWASVVVREVMRIRGFGVKCLLDLLCAFETWFDSQSLSGNVVTPPVAPSSNDLLREWLSDPCPIPVRLLDLPVPAVPEGATFRSLRLRNRTARALHRAGFANRLDRLGRLTIRGLLEIRGFGQASLEDFLSALLKVRPLEPPYPEVTAQTVEEELVKILSVLAPRASPRSMQIALACFGIDQTTNSTLREIGSRFGVSHERVRQIAAGMEGALRGRRRALPILQKAVAAVVPYLPSTQLEIESRLRALGVSEGRLLLPEMYTLAGLVGIDVPWCVTEMGRVAVVVAKTHRDLPDRLTEYCRDAIRRWGTSTIDDVLANVRGGFAGVAPTDLRRLVQFLPGFSWLDEASGWFWLREAARNRLLTPIRKIMAVSHRTQISSVRDAISRVYKLEGFSPPRRVLLEICRQLPGLRVEGEFVVADPAPDWRSELEHVERTLVDILMTHGPVLSRPRFEELSLAAGVNRSTFYAYLNYAPFIERLATGVYALRGSDIPPGTAEALIPRRRSFATTVRLDYGWTTDGNVSVTYRLSAGMLLSGVCGIPAGIRDHVQGEYELRTSDGTAIHRVTVRGSSAWGLSSLFTRRGGDEGDTLRLTFDLRSRIVTAELGADDAEETGTS